MNRLQFRMVLFVCAMGLANMCGAQQLVGTAGGEGSGGNSLLTWSVGEVTTESYSNGNLLTQGVQQPLVSIVLSLNEAPEVALDLTVYPNPTSSHVLLSVGKSALQDLRYILSDSKGNVLQEGIVSESQTLFPLESFSSGYYMLQITTTDKKLKVFKIAKL